MAKLVRNGFLIGLGITALVLSAGASVLVFFFRVPLGPGGNEVPPGPGGDERFRVLEERFRVLEAEKVSHWRAKNCAVAPGPVKEVAPGESFRILCLQSARVAAADLTVKIEDVDYSPMQVHGGVELWPHSLVKVSVRCGATSARAQLPGSGAIPICGRTVTLVRVTDEDDAEFVVSAGPPSTAPE